MCVVSAVSDYYMQPSKLWPAPAQMDDGTKEMLREVIKRLDEIDKRLNDKECMDEQKKAFFKEIGYEG